MTPTEIFDSSANKVGQDTAKNQSWSTKRGKEAMMRPDRFTEQAQQVLVASQELVRQMRHSQWDVEHVFLAMLQQPEGLAHQLLEHLGTNPDKVRERVQQALART